MTVSAGKVSIPSGWCTLITRPIMSKNEVSRQRGDRSTQTHLIAGLIVVQDEQSPKKKSQRKAKINCYNLPLSLPCDSKAVRNTNQPYGKKWAWKRNKWFCWCSILSVADCDSVSVLQFGLFTRITSSLWFSVVFCYHQSHQWERDWNECWSWLYSDCSTSVPPAGLTNHSGNTIITRYILLLLYIIYVAICKHLNF